MRAMHHSFASLAPVPPVLVGGALGAQLSPLVLQPQVFVNDGTGYLIRDPGEPRAKK